MRVFWTTALLVLSMTLAIVSPATAEDAERAAAAASGKTVSEAKGNDTVQRRNRQTAVECSLCDTCGGDWPVFAGAFETGGNNQVSSRARACGGSVRVRTDPNPFLCCR